VRADTALLRPNNSISPGDIMQTLALGMCNEADQEQDQDQEPILDYEYFELDLFRRLIIRV